MSTMLWKPSEESIRQSNMYRFMQFINQRYDRNFDGYAALYEWSVRHIPEFWGVHVGFCRNHPFPTLREGRETTFPKCPAPAGSPARN